MNLKEIIAFIEKNLGRQEANAKPRQLYDPLDYMLELGGKRIRPAVVLGTWKVFKSEFDPSIIDLARAVELFHNFTLIHDDIMDRADLRRGRPTVHNKWDTPTAILSGDLLLIQVYQVLNRIADSDLNDTFSAMASTLCEGQMLDMMFETRNEVSSEEYLEMITGKTAVLLGFCMEGAARLAKQDEQTQHLCRQLGNDLGLAFQLRDDYLDAFGQEEQVGKQIGGDILERKKTYLWNAMYTRLDNKERDTISALYESRKDQEIISEVKNLMEKTKAKDDCLKLAEWYEQRSENAIKSLNELGDTSVLREITTLLAKRAY